MNKTISFSSILGNLDYLLLTLIIFILIDYITGVLKSIYQHKISSKVGAKGIIKKIGYIIIVFLSSTTDYLLGNTDYIRKAVIFMFIANEGISILENWSKMGIKIPSVLKTNIKNLGGDDKNENNKSDI